MRFVTPLLVALLLTACATNQAITYTVPTEPDQPLQPLPQKVLVLNTYDPTPISNNNKRALLLSLTDTVVAQMARQISRTANLPAEPLYGLTPVFTSADQSSIISLMQKHKASHAIVVKEVDAFFDQTNVEVTKTESGKNREAFYDISCNIRYELYNQQGKLESQPVQVRRFHSSRQVISGLLAAGPSMAKNKDHFYALAAENKDRFLRKYFPSAITRRRSLYTTQVFRTVGAAISRNDYTDALQKSLQLTESAPRDVRAKAFYNCAVLSERLNKMADAERYLQRALQLKPLPDAVAMERDLY